MSKAKVSAAVLALAVTVVAGFEGLRTEAYRDPVGIPTICYGETAGVRMGDTATPDQCMARLRLRLAEFGAEISGCLPPDLPPQTHAAFISLAYNIGPTAFCRSTLSKKARAGDLAGACAEIPRWRFAAGQALLGLSVRRLTERQLCEAGLS